MKVLDWFERSFVFRVARFLPLLVAVAAVLALAAGLVLGAYSVLPVGKPLVEVAAVVPPVSVPSAEVLARLAATAGPSAAPRASGPPAVARAPASPSGQPSEAARRIAASVDSLRSILEAVGAPWEGAFVSECTFARAGVCLASQQRLTGTGHRVRLFQALARYDTERGQERVDIGDTTQTKPRTYLVNPSNSDQKLAVLSEITGILAAVPDSLRSEAFRMWLTMRGEAERRRQGAVAAEEVRVQEVNAAREAFRQATTAKRSGARRMGQLSILAALAGALAAGLVLALFAVERNTRTLERLLDSQSLRAPA